MGSPLRVGVRLGVGRVLRLGEGMEEVVKGELEVVSGLCVGCSLVDECPFVRSDEKLQSCIPYTKRVEEV